MKKKALKKKLKLQKENIVNLNQLNSIKGGVKATTTISHYSQVCGIVDHHSVDPTKKKLANFVKNAK